MTQYQFQAVYFEATRKCNLRCPTCMTGSNRVFKRYLLVARGAGAYQTPKERERAGSTPPVSDRRYGTV